MSDLLDAALKHAEKGIPVFPCGPDKAPRVAGGFKSASTDPEIIIQAFEWGPGTMIGACIPEGQVVLDVDPRNGGDETLSTLVNANGSLPRTRRVRTAGGGDHFYFTVPEGVDLRAQLGPGVDVKRAGKGYVIVPPSAGYSYLGGGTPQPLPPWLLDELIQSSDGKVGHTASSPKFFTQFEHGTAYGMAALERQIGRLAMAEHGGRNEALNKAAFSLGQLEAGGELSGDHAFDLLASEAASIGLDLVEIEKTIASGRAAGNDEPWQAPETKAGGGTGGAHTEPWTPPDEGRFWVDWDQDEPDLPFFCHPILPKHAYVLVYGATEASKSMAWVGMLADGSRRGVRTSVYSLENPPATDRKRVRRWGPDPAHFRLTNEHLDMNDGRQVEALILREQDWGDGRGTDVILIDTYSHAFNSRSDDGNAKAIEFARVIRYVMQAVRCSVVVIDHTGYAQVDEPRDASAKRQQVDVAILMKKAGEWRPGQAARFTMDNKKAARFANPFFMTGEIKDTKDGDLALGWIGEHPRWEPKA